MEVERRRGGRVTGDGVAEGSAVWQQELVVGGGHRKKVSGSFLKKRTKKLLARCRGKLKQHVSPTRPDRDKSFLVLFQRPVVWLTSRSSALSKPVQFTGSKSLTWHTDRQSTSSWARRVRECTSRPKTGQAALIASQAALRSGPSFATYAACRPTCRRIDSCRRRWCPRY